VVPRDGIFLGKWRNAFAGNSDGKMNVQSACALNNGNKLYFTRNVYGQRVNKRGHFARFELFTAVTMKNVTF
jgi:hypothetical protein